MEYVKVNNQKDILKIGLRDMNDKDILDEKGEVVCWQFDLLDMELPLKLQEIEVGHKNNTGWLKNQFMVISKRQDVKGKKLLSKNEEDKFKALKEFYIKEERLFDLFLGEGGVKKFLNGRNYYYDMFNDIASAIETIMPKLKQNTENIERRIKEKYSNEEENILE